MSEESPKRGIGTWIKTGVMSVFGLFSGAALMYITALFNNVIKPPEPLANFAYQTQGLTVTFQNHSVNANDGWWDFGDGSAFEQFSPKVDTISHTYTKPGSYTAKLSLGSLFGDKAERAVTVNTDGAGTSAAPPIIQDFQVEAPFAGNAPLTAPATLLAQAKVKNADLLIWSRGDDSSPDTTDAAASQERYLVFTKPGLYTVRLLAVGGKLTAERIKPLQILEGSGPLAIVKVNYPDAHQVHRKTVDLPVTLHWKTEQTGNSCQTQGHQLVPLGCTIVKAELAPKDKDAPVRGETLEVSPDKHKIIVKAEMLKQGTLANAARPVWLAHVKLTYEKCSAASPWKLDLPVPVKVPGITKLPIPCPGGCTQTTRRQLLLDLSDGVRIAWSGDEKHLPTSYPLTLAGKACLVSARVQNSQIVLTVQERATAAVGGPVPLLPIRGN